MVSPLRMRAPPAQIQSPYRWKRSPAAGGAEAIAALGGDGASIAQMYICAACRGYTPDPYAACGRKTGGCGPQKGAGNQTARSKGKEEV